GDRFGHESFQKYFRRGDRHAGNGESDNRNADGRGASAASGRHAFYAVMVYPGNGCCWCSELGNRCRRCATRVRIICRWPRDALERFSKTQAQSRGTTFDGRESVTKAALLMAIVAMSTNNPLGQRPFQAMGGLGWLGDGPTPGDYDNN